MGGNSNKMKNVKGTSQDLDSLVRVAIDAEDFVRVTINQQNYRTNPQLFGRYLTKAQQFLEESYNDGDVIERTQFQSELKNPNNQNYTIDTLVDPKTKEVVAVVVHGVANMPISHDDLNPDGNNQFMAVYYARSRGNGKSAIAKRYEPALKWLLEQAIKSGTEYSAKNSMTNRGLITADSRHKRVWSSLAEAYGGGYVPPEEGVGVPTLSEKAGQDYELNFKEHHKEKLVAIPSNGSWTKSTLINIWAKELEEEYAHKKSGEPGYRPLTTAKYFKDFADAVKALTGRHIVFSPIIQQQMPPGVPFQHS